MTLIEQVAGILTEARISFAVIGATAMAVHGVSRSTRDLDLLIVEPRALLAETWTGLEATGTAVEVRRGDATDPLAGVVRLSTSKASSIDIVVGRAAWQQAAVDAARPAPFGEVRLPVVGREDLILLKLYAGGPQDAWDIQELLAAGSPEVIASVESKVGVVPRDARSLWLQIVKGQ